MRYIKIFFSVFFLIFFTEFVLNFDNYLDAWSKELLAIESIDNNQWLRLDFRVSFIEIEFINGQDTAYLETENTKLPIRFSNTFFDAHDLDELNWVKNNVSKVEELEPFQWVKIESEWKIKLHWWNELAREDVFTPFRELWAWVNSRIKGIKIISRAQWWADESIRYNYSNWNVAKSNAVNIKARKDNECSGLINRFSSEYIYKKVVYNDRNGKSLLWPYQYSAKIKKIVVHHTAESDKSTNLPWKEKMRSIFRYHTLTRWWWDIWYHYVIDQKWNIYEGRAGWDLIVWAHAYCNNIGTIWISLMWNFQNRNPTLAQLSSLARLTAYTWKKYRVDINGRSVYHWNLTSNLLWHRDLRSTACPWDNLYWKITNIKKQIELSDFDFDVSKVVSEKRAEVEIASSYWVIEMDPTSTKVITLTYRNIWTETWKKWTWLYVADNWNRDLFATSIFADKNYVAADLEEDSVYPWKLWHFNVEINSGYEPWMYSLEFVPIINWAKKLEKWTVIQPFNVKSVSNSYTFIQLKPPKREIYYGQSLKAKIKLENTWNTTWQRSWDMKVALKAYPLWRESDFIPKLWDNDPSILARLVEPTVPPWEIWTFEFLMRAPLKSWEFEEKFIPVIWDDLMLWDRSMQFNIKVKRPSYKAQILRESTKNEFFTWEKKTIRIWLKNLSDVSWESEQVDFKIVKSWELKFDSSEYSIAYFVPMHQAWFANVTIQAPNKPGKYTATLQALANGKKFDQLWRFDLEIEVEKPWLSWFVTYQSHDKIYIPKWKTEKVTVRVKNKTTMTWKRNGKNKISVRATNLNSPLRSIKWENAVMASLMNEGSVKPWKTATFDIFLKAPHDFWDWQNLYKENFKVRLNWIWNIEWSDFSIEVIIWDSQLQYVNPSSSNKKSSNNDLKDENSKLSNSKKSDVSKRNSLIIEKFRNMTIEEKIKYLKDRRKNELKIENEVKTEKIKSINYTESSAENIKIKLSFPHSAVNVWAIWDVSYFLDKKQIIANKNSNIWVRADWNYKLIVNVDWKKTVWKHFIAKTMNTNSFVKLNNWNHSPSWNQDLNDNFYRWDIEIFAKDSQVKWKIDVINNLSFEDYLKWIAEVPESSHHDKRKAIAVASRSYAMHYTKTKYRKFPWEYYDWSDDPAVFQKYLWAWYEDRSPKWQLALKESKWEVLEYDWEILRAAYFSCSDWKTRSPKEARWGNGYFEKVSEVYQSVSDENWKDLNRYRKGQCGHWVWMSGLWAESMANNGNSYKRILHYYYQNVDVVKR